MTSSPSIAALAASLAKAQAKMAGAKKDSTNPHFKSAYADLASVWDACREPLTANGLSVVQLTGKTPDGVTIETILLHSTGEFIASLLTVPVTQDTAQGVGSAITYGRRYALAAMVGIAPEDDDGNAASEKPGMKALEQQRQARKPSPTTAPDPDDIPMDFPKSTRNQEPDDL